MRRIDSFSKFAHVISIQTPYVPFMPQVMADIFIAIKVKKEWESVFLSCQLSVSKLNHVVVKCFQKVFLSCYSVCLT